MKLSKETIKFIDAYHFMVKDSNYNYKKIASLTTHHTNLLYLLVILDCTKRIIKNKK